MHAQSPIMFIIYQVRLAYSIHLPVTDGLKDVGVNDTGIAVLTTLRNNTPPPVNM